MKSSKQLEIEQDFLVAMTDLVMALRDVLHKVDELNHFLDNHAATLNRLERKVDQIHMQTIKTETVEGVEDYDNKS